MVPIVGKPCMEHIVELLRRHGFEDVIVTVAFLPQAIRSYFGGGEGLGVDIGYSVEESPLGTAGSVKRAAGRLDDTFLVISGDALCDVDLTQIVAAHREKGASVTIGLKSVENPLEFGIVVTDEDGRVERFLEKPSWGQVFSDTINTGIYVLEPEVLKHIPQDRPYDFSKELFPLLLEMGRPIYGYRTSATSTSTGRRTSTRSTSACSSRSRASASAATSGWGTGWTSTTSRRSPGPRTSATTAGSRAARTSARTACSRRA
jgi:mannose-1-phosphate guanylyltransferase/phosphomannomutase